MHPAQGGITSCAVLC